MSVYFSRFLVTEHVFYRSKFSYAMVNLKPILPGHVLVVPLRTSVHRLQDLSPEEATDFFKTLKIVQGFMLWEHQAPAANLAIQDGPEAGQTVNHLHAHIIPRQRLNNIGDKVYERLDEWNFETRRKEYLTSMPEQGSRMTPDSERKSRTKSEMITEAQHLKFKFDEYMKIHGMSYN